MGSPKTGSQRMLADNDISAWVSCVLAAYYGSLVTAARYKNVRWPYACCIASLVYQLCVFVIWWLAGRWEPFLFLDDTERHRRPWAGFDRLVEFGKRRWIWWWRGIYIHPELSDCLRDRRTSITSDRTISIGWKRVPLSTFVTAREIRDEFWKV